MPPVIVTAVGSDENTALLIGCCHLEHLELQQSRERLLFDQLFSYFGIMGKIASSEVDLSFAETANKTCEKLKLPTGRSNDSASGITICVYSHEISLLNLFLNGLQPIKHKQQ